MATFKLGKLPARPSAAALKFSNYVDPSQFPPLPASFGHDGLITDWAMLGNDQYGDCVEAGAAHETALLNKVVGNTVTFTDAGVLSDYTAITGFNANDPTTDNGTDVQQAAQYRQKIGVIDATGKRHTIAAFLSLHPGDVTSLYLATYLFNCVGIGIMFPSTASDQFDAGQPWNVVPGATNEGGHYVPLVGRDADGMLHVVTWGKKQLMTEAFLKAQCDEAWAYVSQENLVNQKSPEGFDYDTLIKDLAAL